MECTSLEEVRENIDRIDNEIIKLMLEMIYREMISRFVSRELEEFSKAKE